LQFTCGGAVDPARRSLAAFGGMVEYGARWKNGIAMSLNIKASEARKDHYEVGLNFGDFFFCGINSLGGCDAKMVQ
jgi:hypothetical protein